MTNPAARIATLFAISTLTALMACSVNTTTTSTHPNTNGDDDDDTGSSGSPGTHTGTASSADVTSFATTYCAALTPCCPSSKAPPAPDTYASLCKLGVAQAVASTYTKTLGDACLAAVKKAAGANFCAAPGVFVEQCKSLFNQAGRKPTAGAGASCETSGCSIPANGAENCTSTTPSSTALVCRNETIGKVGDTCDATMSTSGLVEALDIDHTATTGVICDGQTAFCDPSTKKCTAVPAVGQACTLGTLDTPAVQSCGMFAYCTSAGGGNLKCVAQVTTGATCTHSDDCLGGGTCDNGKCSDVNEGFDSVGALGPTDGGGCYNSKITIGGG